MDLQSQHERSNSWLKKEIVLLKLQKFDTNNL